MRPKYDPKYCPHCYQYTGGSDCDGFPEACRACFGDSSETETAFEAAFLMLADIDGAAEDGDADIDQETVRGDIPVLYAGESDSPHITQQH
jgi:hypothetical protein